MAINKRLGISEARREETVSHDGRMRDGQRRGERGGGERGREMGGGEAAELGRSKRAGAVGGVAAFEWALRSRLV
jgi:hypothetical protein